MATHVCDIGFVTPRDSGYRMTMHDMAAMNQGIRKGPRAAGEVLGGQVERAARHYLGAHIALQAERILRWKQIDHSRRYATRYRELDAVERLDTNSLCLFEIKLNGVRGMERGEGLRQLRKSTQTLLMSQEYKRICRRLVYISDDPVKVKGGLPAVGVEDVESEEAVIWLSSKTIESAASDLGIILPDNWLDPAARIGSLKAEDEEWRSYVEGAGSGTWLSHSLADAFRRVARVA
jgi:hypothetical protein